MKTAYLQILIATNKNPKYVLFMHWVIFVIWSSSVYNIYNNRDNISWKIDDSCILFTYYDHIVVTSPEWETSHVVTCNIDNLHHLAPHHPVHHVRDEDCSLDRLRPTVSSPWALTWWENSELLMECQFIKRDAELLNKIIDI